MIRRKTSWIVAFVTFNFIFTSGGSQSAATNSGPVILELFTSEGCSSCPPADILLSEVMKNDPANIAGMSEHVDYWNSLGWKDPNSAANFAERQNAYAKKLGVNSVYTPQLIVDGISQDVGNNPVAVGKLLKIARSNPPEKLSVSCEAAKNNEISVSIEFDRLQKPGCTAHIVITEDKIISHVTSGENRGKQLKHDGVVRFFSSSDLQGKKEIAIRLSLKSVWKKTNLRVIGFIQEAGPGRIVASGICQLP